MLKEKILKIIKKQDDGETVLTLFPIALTAIVVLALVVMYDACGVRRAAGKQAKLLNEIVNTPGLSSIEVKGKLQEALGHTPVQVFVGATIGLIAGLVL